MKILALELSSGQGSIALIEDDKEIFASDFSNNRKHSGAFFEDLKDCLDCFGVPNRIIVGLGPGSYAGTRIAISAAIGLQAATGAELIGLSSFRALATNADEFTVVGDARRQSFWFAQVRARRCLRDPFLCTREELADHLALVSHPIFTAETLMAFPKIPLVYPSAKILAQISTDIISAPLEPIYLREPHITQPKVARV